MSSSSAPDKPSETPQSLTPQLFRDHLLGTFDATCMALSRKLWSLEQIAKYFKQRASITSDYAKSLEKLASRDLSLVFEETYITNIMTKTAESELAMAHEHARLAEKAQNGITAQLIATKESLEKIRKTTTIEGQAAKKALDDSLSALEKAKTAYLKESRELEYNEYMLQMDKQENVPPAGIAKREKKIAKLRQEATEAESAYRKQLLDTTAIQNEFYKRKLPALLDRLEKVYKQRIQQIDSLVLAYADSLCDMFSRCVPSAVNIKVAASEFSLEKEEEEFVTKTETFFRVPPEPTFVPFVRAPPGQVPQSVQASQKSWTNRIHLPLRKAVSQDVPDAPAAAPPTKPNADGTFELFGTDLEIVMEKQKAQYPNLRVPYILVFLAKCIIDKKGTEVVGTFRLSGCLPRMEELKMKYRNGEYEIPYDVHDATGIFRYFLRSLPESLVPADLYESILSEDPSSFSAFNTCPALSRTIIGFVVRFLREYFLKPEVVEKTLMDAENLATIFFPCVLRNPSTDLNEVVKRMPYEKAWMTKILVNLDVSSFPSLEECLSIVNSSGGAPQAPPSESKTGTKESSSSSDIPPPSVPSPKVVSTDLHNVSSPPVPNKELPPIPPALSVDNVPPPSNPPPAAATVPIVPYDVSPPSLPSVSSFAGVSAPEAGDVVLSEPSIYEESSPADKDSNSSNPSDDSQKQDKPSSDAPKPDLNLVGGSAPAANGDLKLFDALQTTQGPTITIGSPHGNLAISDDLKLDFSAFDNTGSGMVLDGADEPSK